MYRNTPQRAAVLHPSRFHWHLEEAPQRSDEEQVKPWTGRKGGGGWGAKRCSPRLFSRPHCRAHFSHHFIGWKTSVSFVNIVTADWPVAHTAFARTPTCHLQAMIYLPVCELKHVYYMYITNIQLTPGSRWSPRLQVWGAPGVQRSKKLILNPLVKMRISTAILST